MRNLKAGVAVFLMSFFLFNCNAKGFTVKTLQQGEIAPYKGFLYSPEADKAARIAISENDHYKVLTKEQIEALRIAQNQINNRNEMIATLNSEIDGNDKMKILYFIGGALAGGFIVNELRK